MEPTEKPATNRAGTAILIALAVVAAPFVPLLLAFVEDACFNSNYVEDACRFLGVHDELGDFYELFGIM